MPRNLFGGSTADIIEAGRAGREDSQYFLDRATTNRAGRQLATGDRAGAAATFAGGGMIDNSRQMTNDQNALDRQEAQDAQGADDRKQKMLVQQLGFMKQIATSLETVPEGQRKAQLDRLMPILRDIGAPVEQIAGLREEDLVTPTLRAFGAEADQRIKLFNTRGGVVAVDEQALSRDINDPNATRTVYEDPYYDDMQEATIEQKRAAAEKSRRPPAPRGGGRGGGRGGKAKSYGADEVQW